MEKKIIIVSAILALLLFGCLQPPNKIGCCLKENATAHEGCFLYNDTSDTFKDLRDKTFPESDGNKCNLTAGYCNVNISGMAQPYKVPICT